METEIKNNNPIHPDKITETPHLLPYAHHVGSAIIKPLDKGKTKGVAMKAMYQQTEQQLQTCTRICILSIPKKRSNLDNFNGSTTGMGKKHSLYLSG